MFIKVNEDELEGSLKHYASDVICEGEETLSIQHTGTRINHDEYMAVLEGRLQVVLAGKKMIVKAGDPLVHIPACMPHCLQGFEGERLWFREVPSPNTLEKALFFNDLCSRGNLSSFWHLMRVFYDGNCYAALPLNSRFLDSVVSLQYNSCARPEQ
ncbi:hypothetical protein F5Y16DRAFT_410474 [Xylariaceae sp. FL0255]|nr:hypothetical protein F5Y16DRAFT_410474 [Xylariaceae sp. FL0255]